MYAAVKTILNYAQSVTRKLTKVEFESVLRCFESVWRFLEDCVREREIGVRVRPALEKEVL